MSRLNSVLSLMAFGVFLLAGSPTQAAPQLMNCLYENGERLGVFVVDVEEPRITNIYDHNYPIMKHDKHFVTFRIEATNPAPVHLASYVAIHLKSGKFVQSRVFAACGNNDCGTNFALKPSVQTGACSAG